MFCGKGYMLFRFTVMMCVFLAVVGGKLRFLSGRTRDLWHCTFRHSFRFVSANYCNLFYDCNSFWSLGKVFAHGSEFPLSLKVDGLGHGVENYCWPVTVVNVLKRTREGVRLVFSIVTVTCRFGLAAYYGVYESWLPSWCICSSRHSFVPYPVRDQ